ncbi:MAG TPA: Fic family protein [Candidatus Kryptonia bacterium]
MDLKEYSAGVFTQQYGYKSFDPTTINHEWSWSDPKINKLLADASRKLGELNAFAHSVPDIDVFIRMHVAKEAAKSSRIEGTKTEIEEAVSDKQDVLPGKREDWQEVQNYITAMNAAIEELKDIPLSTRMLKKTHKILLAGVRGTHKTPGEYRTSQNWIGGASIEDAVFVPPHHSRIDTLMGDLENFLHNVNIDVPELIRIAIAHYQFETIHPFLDGNGRIGRLLITLYLVSKGLLSKPTLYLSDYLEKHKGVYYDNLTLVRTHHDITQWVKFILVAIAETSNTGVETLKKILKLKDDIEGTRIVGMGKKVKSARLFMNVLYSNPVITINSAKQKLGLTHPTTGALIADFERLGILKEVTGFKRNRLFLFTEYLNLFM